MSRRLKHHIIRNFGQGHVPEADLSMLSEEELRELWNEVLENGTHGLCFSLYEDGQKPGDQISKNV